MLEPINLGWVKIEFVSIPISDPLDAETERSFRGGPDHISLCRSSLVWLRSNGSRLTNVEPQLNGYVADLMRIDDFTLVECGEIDLYKISSYLHLGWSVLLVPYLQAMAIRIIVIDRFAMLRKCSFRRAM